MSAPHQVADLASELKDISERAGQEFVGLEMWMGGSAEGDYVWISEFHRDPKASPGAGRHWLDRVLALAHGAGLCVRLCCTAWNSGLVAYYERAGFKPLYEDGEEVYLEAAPPPSRAT